MPATSSAPFWEKHREVVRELFGPVSEALIEDAGVVSGSSVLDVATGHGEPALRIAEVVGSSGEVVGADPSVEMIEEARRVASQLSLKNVRFEVAGADSLPFPDDHFDAVISRFGVMFFPSPVNGIREMLRVLKPGRTMSFAVWHHLDDNPFHYIAARIVDRFSPEPKREGGIRWLVPDDTAHPSIKQESDCNRDRRIGHFPHEHPQSKIFTDSSCCRD